jgi:cell division protein FtsZ
MQVAEAGIAALREHIDSLITIPNEKLMAVLGGGTTLLDAFKAANDVLLGAVKGISDLITKGGIINVDFADVRTVMGEMGMAMMGTGTASGENRAEEAARKAICSPLLEDVDLQGARGLLINISGNTDISLEEYSLVNGIIADMAHPDANIIIGTAIDPEIGDALSVTVVATGLGQAETLKVVRGGRASQPVTSPQNYGDLDQPAINRRNPREPAPMRNAPAASTAEDLSFIDIPTFLRRQAD